MPRTYRGRDVLWWMDASGVWDQRYDEVDDLTRARRLPSPQLVGTPERATLDLNALADAGRRAGRPLGGRAGRHARCSPAGCATCSRSPTSSSSACWTPSTTGLGPRRATPRSTRPSASPPTRVPASARWQLDLRSGEIRTIVWATGFRPDYGWLDVPVVDAKGQPAPRRRRGRQPRPVRAGPARAAAAQVHVHPRHRGRRARGGRSPQRLPGRTTVISTARQRSASGVWSGGRHRPDLVTGVPEEIHQGALTRLIKTGDRQDRAGTGHRLRRSTSSKRSLINSRTESARAW